MRKGLSFSTRSCFWCGDEYMPTSGTQIYCPECKGVADEMRDLLTRKTKQTLFRARYPNGKPHRVRVCRMCGQEFQWTGTCQRVCLQCRHKKEEKMIRDAGLKRYGITEQEYGELYRAQGGKCAVCGKENSGATQNGKRKKMYVDHDHETGRVEGLLCNNCNFALGFVHDDPELLTKLVAYLENGQRLFALEVPQLSF